MGSVYVARQLSTGKERALKIIQPQFVSDPRTRERFTREARAGSQIDSEHVVEVVGAGIDAEAGVPWLAMELLRGENLEAFATRVGPLAEREVLEIFRQLCHGLAAAHAAGLVHRDLKPENVFLAAARRVGVPFTVKLLDFGIAKVVHETKHDVTDAVGTPTWMAPEQTEAGRSITPASDVWALGLIAFRLLTGKNYWRSANEPDIKPMAVLREVVFEPMEPASVRARSLGSPVRLSIDFDGWFARAVQREPEKRFADAARAFAALAPILSSGADASAAPALIGPIEQVPPTAPGEPFRFGAARGKANDAIATEIEIAPAATRVGPFTGPSEGELRRWTSAPPSEDVDTYQRRLSRSKAWFRATAVALLGAAGFGAFELRTRVTRPAPFSGHESEPNDRAPDANPVPFGERVRGHIGQRLDADRSDRDFFRTTVPQGTGRVRVSYRALPNIAPCILVYRLGIDEPLHRFCTGEPARDLVVPELRLAAGEYLFAVLQDRDQYTEAPPPPVFENISDEYELGVDTADEMPDVETEPNDVPQSASRVKPGGVLRGRLAWMRDTDVVCAEGVSGKVHFVVEDALPRPHGAVLEVTPIGGPSGGIPVRVHHPKASGQVTERDVRSPWTSPPTDDPSPCVSLTLGRDVWSSPPLPRVPPASDHEYVVRVEGS
jgi:serine/threonine protein kinase